MSVAAPPVREQRPAPPSPAPAAVTAPPTAAAAPGALAPASARVPAPAPTPLPPGAPAHELDLRGGSALEATGEVVDYVRSKGSAGAPVRVRVGTIAAGQVTVVARGGALHTPRTQAIPLLLPVFDPLRTAGIDPVLALDISDRAVVGYASVRVKDRVLSKNAGLAGELRKHADLIGWAGLDRLNLPELTNELQDTTLVLRCTGLSFQVGGFLDAKGSFGLANEVVTFSATATGKVPGLATITVPIERSEDGSLSGKVAVDLTIKGFSGQVEASFAHGVVDVIGTVRYANEKFDGTVTIAATDKENAKALSTAHTPAEVRTTAPAAEGAAPHEGAAPAPAPTAPAAAGAGPAAGAAVTAKKGPRVLVGWGTVTIQLAEWLSGEAIVLVDAEGDVTVVGKITPRMTKPLFEQRDYVHALPKLEVRAAYGIPVVGDIFVFANVGLEALAKLGPATLTDMEMVGTWSTKPSVLQSFGLTGTLNISAFAGLRLRAEGGVGLEILDHDIKVGVGVAALAGIRGYVDATPRIGYREVADPAAGKKGEFYIGGHLDIAAQPFLQLSGDFFVDLDSPWWSPAPDKRWTWPLGSLEYPLPGEFGIGADVEHVLGSGKMPEIQFGKVDFNPSRFMTDLVDDHVPPKKSVDEKKKGGWKESQPAPEAAPAPAAAPPGKALPTGPAGAPPQVAGAGPKPVAGGKPTVGGPSGKTAAEAAQTPKPENDAKVKKAMAGYAEVMNKEKNHPEDDVQIHDTMAKLAALGFINPQATAKGDRWHIATSINPPLTATLPKAQSPAGGAAKVPPALVLPPNTDVEMREGPFTAKRVSYRSVEAKKVEVGGRQSMLQLTYSVGDKKYVWHAQDAGGADATFKLAGPLATGPRKRKLTTSEHGVRATHVAGEVGVSDTRSKPKGEPPGWDVLGGKGVLWERAHILDGYLDGPGDAWNLAIVPKEVNGSLHQTYEKTLKAQTRKGYRYMIDNTVTYRTSGSSPAAEKALQAQNKRFDITHFPIGITIEYKPVEPPATENGHFSVPVRLPRPDELESNP